MEIISAKRQISTVRFWTVRFLPTSTAIPVTWPTTPYPLAMKTITSPTMMSSTPIMAIQVGETTRPA